MTGAATLPLPAIGGVSLGSRATSGRDEPEPEPPAPTPLRGLALLPATLASSWQGTGFGAGSAITVPVPVPLGRATTGDLVTGLIASAITVGILTNRQREQRALGRALRPARSARPATGHGTARDSFDYYADWRNGGGDRAGSPRRHRRSIRRPRRSSSRQRRRASASRRSSTASPS